MYLAMKSVFLETFGCQMNELDSELVRGHLESLGYTFTTDPKSAEILLYNTCSVREHAESKAYSRIGLVGARKRSGEQLVLGVIGCMAERDGKDMLRRHPQVDLLCGPGELDKLPALIDNVSRTQSSSTASRVALAGNTSRRSAALSAAQGDLETLDLARAFDPDHSSGSRSAYVRITRGCNKFCTYCVVPYTRGAEVHRPPDDIVVECRKLAEAGVLEVTLLGQTVNHYCYTHGTAMTVQGREVPQVGPGLSAFREKSSPSAAQTTSFAGLLARIHDEVPALQRIRFLTSYPRDFSDETLEVMATRPRICPFLHVPAQSGSNRILKLMNRGYTVEEYLEFIDRAQTIVPDISIAGDIIVGFPGETEEDFQATKDLLRRVPFKNNYIFKYSPRPGTTAINRFPDDVPTEVKKDRNNRLLSLQAEVSADVHAGWVGRETEVFFERLTHRHPDGSRKVSGADPRVQLGWNSTTPNAVQTVQISGRTPGDLITVCEVSDHTQAQQLLGTISRVQIDESGSLLLRGHLI
jgi:tRNA-2-methylthio-N6-dimethylallyladenosine synthase